MYPLGCVPPKFYGLPKIHKPDTPLRPIVSSCKSVTYGVAKDLTKILKPLVGKSPHHINNTYDFVQQVKQVTLAPGECFSSYDVSALFTSVPGDPALEVIKDLLEKDSTLKDRTVLPVKDIILLFEFSVLHPTTSLWQRYVDDTFVIQKEANKQDFLQHINSVDPVIQFIVENNKEDGTIPFLDTIVKSEADGNLSITVYMKPTHKDQYVQLGSHHHLSGKFSVINMLTHKAQTVCSNPELLCKEMDHLRKALTQCKYP